MRKMSAYGWFIGGLLATGCYAAAEPPQGKGTEIRLWVAGSSSLHECMRVVGRGFTAEARMSMDGPAFGGELSRRYLAWQEKRGKGKPKPATSRDAAAKPAPNTDFKLWWPEGITPRGVLMITLHGDGKAFTNQGWRRFCVQHRLAYVCFGGNSVQRGSVPGSVMQDALTQLGEAGGHPELPRMPFLIYGFSNGSGAATAMAMQFPERTIGWAAGHPGGSWPLKIAGLHRSIGMVAHGMKDTWFLGQNDQEKVVAELRRKALAPINLAVNYQGKHGFSYGMVQAFFSAALEVRDPQVDADGKYTLKPIDQTKGFLAPMYDKAAGGPQDLPVVPYADFEGDPGTMNWLPTRAFAERWQRYVKSGT